MLKQGAAGLGIGVLKGATDLVYEPFKGARKHGARGFAIGVGKGLAGAALRPTAGLLKMTESWAGDGCCSLTVLRERALMVAVWAMEAAVCALPHAPRQPDAHCALLNV